MATKSRSAEALDSLQPDGVNIFAAQYTTDAGRFKKNPLCEALDPTPKIEHYEALYCSLPPKPTAAIRRMSVENRRQEMLAMSDLVIYFHEWRQIAQALDDMIRKAYSWRNPLTAPGKLMLYGQARHGDKIPKFKLGTIDKHASGLLVMAVTGMGKSTFLRIYLDRYPKVIVHTSYNGQPFKAHQIPIVTLRIPPDGTLRSLCYQFFEYIDNLLNTEYLRQAKGFRTIALQVDLMKQVARTCHVGLLAIDEVQNLRHADKAYANEILSLFSEIIEKVGISVLCMATPALNDVIKNSARNTRKISSFGTVRIPPMANVKGGQWDNFCEAYWKYNYLQKESKLTPEIKQVWYALSGGDSAFAALVFYLAQRGELGDQEYLDESSFLRAFEKDMYFLAPAINALISNVADELKGFDDLYDQDLWEAVRTAMDRADDENPSQPPSGPGGIVVEHAKPNDGEGDEGARASKPAKDTSKVRKPADRKLKPRAPKKTVASKKLTAQIETIDLPTEDALRDSSPPRRAR